MVQPGRVACIFTPFVLTLAALGCLVVIFLSGTIDRNTTLNDLYFLKLDLQNITLKSSANLASSLTNANLTALDGALQAVKQSYGMKDHYTVYLRSYCAWNHNDEYSYCSPPQAKFHFDPVEIWGLSNSSVTGYNVTQILPQSFRKGLATYKTLSITIWYLYTVGLAATVITVVIGFTAIFSRWGSFLTSACAAISATTIVAGSVLASVLFPILRGALRETLDDHYRTKTSLGSRVYALTWVAAAFALASGLFWTLSICCCSGRSPYNRGSKDARRTRAEKTPYTYERVGSPYMGPRDSQAVPLNTLPGQGHMGYSSNPTGQRDAHTSYEPFRPQHG